MNNKFIVLYKVYYSSQLSYVNVLINPTDKSIYVFDLDERIARKILTYENINMHVNITALNTILYDLLDRVDTYSLKLIDKHNNTCAYFEFEPNFNISQDNPKMNLEHVDIIRKIYNIFMYKNKLTENVYINCNDIILNYTVLGNDSIKVSDEIINEILKSY